MRWGLFHKTNLPNKPGLFQFVWLILNQIKWQYIRLTEINLAYLVNLFYEIAPWTVPLLFIPCCLPFDLCLCDPLWLFAACSDLCLLYLFKLDLPWTLLFAGDQTCLLSFADYTFNKAANGYKLCWPRVTLITNLKCVFLCNVKNCLLWNTIWKLDYHFLREIPVVTRQKKNSVRDKLI